MDISTGACGWNGEEIANFQTTLGLPYVSIPRTLFEKDFKGTNPNANPICGRKVRLTNMRTGSIMDGMVMDGKSGKEIVLARLTRFRLTCIQFISSSQLRDTARAELHWARRHGTRTQLV